MNIQGFITFDEVEPKLVGGGLIITDQNCEMTLRLEKTFVGAKEAHEVLQIKAAEFKKLLEGFKLERKTELQS